MNKTNTTPDSIKQLLNRSVTRLDGKTIENLRSSRNLALKRHRELQHAPVQAWLTHHGLWAGDSHSHHKHVYWALIVIFVACLFTGITYVQHDHDHSDVDIELLTDDLPVDAYVE